MNDLSDLMRYTKCVKHRCTGCDLVWFFREAAGFRQTESGFCGIFCRIADLRIVFIKLIIKNFSDYDVIFVGYPLWWYDMPMAIYSFLDGYSDLMHRIAFNGSHDAAARSKERSHHHSCQDNSNSQDNIAALICGHALSAQIIYATPVPDATHEAHRPFLQRGHLRYV